MPEAQKTSWGKHGEKQAAGEKALFAFSSMCPSSGIAPAVLVICQEGISLGLLITENLDTIYCI